MTHDSNRSHIRQYDRHSTTDRLSHAWDTEYLKGRYRAETPLKFTADIINELKCSPSLVNGSGLYVGCGNGRNYAQMVESGLEVIGLDISSVALSELSKKLPQYSNLLVCGDFLDYRPDIKFQYVIAIQVFQHGDRLMADKYFKKASSLLESGGLMFLRVNASNTIMCREHDIIEKNDTGSFTVLYKEGPKKGLDIRFFSKEDLFDLINKNNMSAMHELKNITTKRLPPYTGSWSQWEMIARKD